jgi:hypothetical protein
MDPPGCITAVMPASFAIAQSGKGKKTSLAIEAPCKSNQKLLLFYTCTKSTLDVWPVPDAISVPFFAKQSCLTLCFTNFRSRLNLQFPVLKD